MEDVVVSGSFDNIRSRQVRFLQEASSYGLVHVYLWSDQAVRRITGETPRFPEQERKYLLEALRYIHKVWIVDDVLDPDRLPEIEGFRPGVWAVSESEDTARKQGYCTSESISYKVIKDASLSGFPIPKPETYPLPSHKKVLVTGCYDWFHSGHVRFFEETSGLGDLYVVVGHDENVRLLKGEGHPLHSQEERHYMVASIRFVKQSLISSGSGWMDAEPEIKAIQPDLYVVNEDGDKPDKREFCEQHGLEYVVLKRNPAAGLPRRESTHLRGF